LLSDEPLLGGTTDIDIVLVHKYQAPVERETYTLTPEISVDILHKIQDDYAQYRQLRQNTWLGYPLTYYGIILLDTDHWLEYIQSSVNAEFHRADNVLARVNALGSSARENWFALMRTPSQTYVDWLHQYLETLALAANAISGLIGPPLTTRRFMIAYRKNVEALGVPQLLAGFNGLLGFNDLELEKVLGWVEGFEKDFDHLLATEDPPTHLSLCRRAYYVNAIRALADSGDHNLAAWPLLDTWLDIHRNATQPFPGIEAWEDCLSTLELEETNSAHKLEALDAYLDTMEITIENWAAAYGI